MKEKKRGKPPIERKGVKKMQSAPAVYVDKHKKPFAQLWARRASRSKHESAVTDRLLRDDLSKFEKDLILECREIGMSDDEIETWLREI